MNWFKKQKLWVKILIPLVLIIIIANIFKGAPSPLNIEFNDIIKHEKFIKGNLENSEGLKDYLEIDKQNNNDLSKYYLYLAQLDVANTNPIIELSKNNDLSSVDKIDKYIKEFNSVGSDYKYYNLLKQKFDKDLEKIEELLYRKLFGLINGTFKGKYYSGYTVTYGKIYIKDSVCNKQYSTNTEYGKLRKFKFDSDTIDNESNIKGRNTFFAEWKSDADNSGNFQINTMSPKHNKVFYKLGNKYWKISSTVEINTQNKDILNKVLKNLYLLNKDKIYY